MDAVAGCTLNGLGDVAKVPDAAVPGLGLQALGGAVTRQAVQAVGAAVAGLGLVVEAGHAAIGLALLGASETTGRVPAVSGAVQAAVEAAHLAAGAAY